MLPDLSGCPIAEATLESAVAACHEQLAEVEATIKRGGEGAEVAPFDDTGVSIGGKTSWLHVASTPSLTVYAVHEKRGREARDEIGVLPKYQGRSLHDGQLPAAGKRGLGGHPKPAPRLGKDAPA